MKYWFFFVDISLAMLTVFKTKKINYLFLLINKTLGKMINYFVNQHSRFKN